MSISPWQWIRGTDFASYERRHRALPGRPGVQLAKLAEVVQKALALAGRLDLRFSLQEPSGAKDRNDVLRARPHPLLPYRPEVPSVV
jgi:hypothetical protein